ncbi:hypothetical protein ACQ4LE_002874 [Meloidogyne hapla]|uniref:FTH domain-containing protein n=1 Tax=Meloidogyne hapla TaxID=6305 RepID=A0A1I8BD19_MELHA
MLIARYWLERLFNCSFEFIQFEDFIINPELIKLLFEDEGKISLQFRSKTAYLSFCNNSASLLNIAMNHLITRENLTIGNFENDSENYIDDLFKLLVNKGKNFPRIRIEILNSSKIHDLLIKHIETSTDLSKMVARITLVYGHYSNVRINLSPRATNIEKIFEIRGYLIDYEYYTKYKLTNIYNPKMEFSICCNEGRSDEVVSKVNIERING